MDLASSAGAGGQSARGPARAREWPPQSYLASLAPPAQESLLAIGQRRVFSPGQVFITQGDTARETFVLLRGVTKVVVYGPVGPQLIDMQAEGDTVGEMAALDGRPRSATVTAVGRVEAVQVGSEDLHAFFEANPAAAIAMARMLSARERRKIDQILDFNQLGVTERVARALVALGEKYGRPEQEGLVLDALISQPELAGLVGASEPAVHKAFRVLRVNGALETGYRRMVIVDSAKLRLAGQIVGEGPSPHAEDRIFLQVSPLPGDLIGR